MKQFYLVVFTLLLTAGYASSQNPIVPAGVYIADPSAHVCSDGKLYIYGSNDESTDYYCSWTHHVLSTNNMKTWELTRDVFSSKGENDGVPYNDELLFAPDCQYKNGTYYLYYCQPSNIEAEGVATSKSPLGPFINGTRIDTRNYSQIDPCVFIDDDGQAYYIWGQFTAKMAKLKPTMTEIDFSTIKDSIVTEKEHFFHEGGYMVKRNGIYYFIYADISRSNRPTCIGYATSNSPMGPFKYRGVIIDNDNCDPNNWNNHGSIVEYNGQWYVFYHRATHNSNMMRKACAEPITFNEDGSINEVEMTTQGAGRPIKADSKIEAEHACLLFGNTRIEAFSPSEEKLGQMKNGDKTAYKYIQFPDEVKSIKVRARSLRKGGTLQFRTGQPWHHSIANVTIPEANTYHEWITITSEVKPTNGIHALWLLFWGDKDAEIEVDWFKFSK